MKMKNTIILLCLVMFILLGCNNDIKRNTNISTNKSSELKDTFSIYGIWALTSYFDSIFEYKTISKFRLNPHSWSSLLIEIKKDSLTSYGTIYTKKAYSIKSVNDTIAILNEKWGLIKTDNNTIVMKQIYDPNKHGEKDSISYEYKKREDLAFLLGGLSDKNDYDFPYYFQKNFDNFFNKNLFSGLYVDDKGNKVVFEEDGTIQGFFDFNKFQVDSYFGTSHWLKNHDNITFYRDASNVKGGFTDETYVWKFIGDTLVLNKVVYEIFSVQGQKVREPELWSFDKNEIRLSKRSK
jgi:hypothetical protein